MGDQSVEKGNLSITFGIDGKLVGMFLKMFEPTESHKSFASLPYIKGVTEPLTRILRKQDVTVVSKPFTTLQQQFPAPKFRPSMESQTNVVYKIPCTKLFLVLYWGNQQSFQYPKKRTFEKHQNCGKRF